MRIGAVVEGVGVAIDFYTLAQGRGSASYTTVTVLAEAPDDLTLHIYAEDFFATLDKKLGGMQDVVVGHREFDERFVVKSSDEDLARAWIVPSVAALLSPLEWFEHRLEAGRVTSTCTGIVNDVGGLMYAAQATARLAGRGASLRAEWIRIAEVLGGVPHGQPWREEAPAIAIGGPAAPVFIQLAHGALPDDPTKRRFLTRVLGARGGARRELFVAAARDKLTDRHGEVVSTPIATRFEVRSSNAAVTAARLDEGLTQALDSLGPDAIVGKESDVSVLFCGVMLDAGRLQAAMAIVRQLAAAEQTGPYR
jgi:hypothetical protein